ncbi:hypothetical protein BJY01DRAFT_255957 [Aspergillus pseudoustus]|uniref:Uncharacterized protein n=1 Tax=Aspergillus pseudoustus TaxID=1810923 RepID=A0ABR4IH50_9EURO
MSSELAQVTEPRLVKLQNGDGSFKIGISSWLKHAMDSPQTLFDEVNAQQTAFSDRIKKLQSDLAAERLQWAAHTAREAKSASEHRSKIAELEVRLSAKDNEFKDCKAQVIDLEGKLAEQRLQLKTSKARVSELEAKAVTQELQAKASRARVSELEARLSAHRRANSQSDADRSDLFRGRSTWRSPNIVVVSNTHPDPPKLVDGAQPKFSNWRYLMECSFPETENDPDTAASCLAYLVGRTSGEAQDQIVARLQSNTLPPITDGKGALDYLDMLYNDPELESDNPADYHPPGQGRDIFWKSFSDFIWNAVKYRYPEEDWSHRLHAYLRWKYGHETISEFSTFSQGGPKELAKEAYLCLLRRQEENGYLDLV